MRSRSRYFLAASFFVSFYLLYTWVQKVDDKSRLFEPGELNPHSGLQPRSPKITVTAIWVPRNTDVPIYFPYFFQSVEANPEVDLLFIQIDKFNVGCNSYSKARNVRELCMTEDQYIEVHANFLCEEWQCTEEMKQLVLEKIREESVWDSNNTFFRVLRNGVFKRWMDPATTIWGWCDVDEFWGNFARAFPWDVAHDFDILVPASQPEFANQKLIFTRGHLAFFRNSPDVLKRFLTYHKFASVSNYLYDNTIPIDAEESSFSHFMFSEETSFTFLTFEAMVNNWDVTLMSSKGVYYSPMPTEDVTLSTRRTLLSLVLSSDTSRLPTFSDSGNETEAVVFTDGQYYESSLWFHRKYATYVVTGWTRPEEREQKHNLIRRQPHGPITQRIELREPHLHRRNNIIVDECLYKHWQVEKHEPWFKKMREGGLEPNEVLVHYKNAEAEIWTEDGAIIHSTNS